MNRKSDAGPEGRLPNISPARNPDFLPHSAGRGRACAFQKGKAHEVCQSHQVPQEIRGRAGRRIAKIVERWRRDPTYIRGAAPPALGRCCGIDVPALPGWAEVWLPALRAWVRFKVYFRVPTQTLKPSCAAALCG